MIVWEIEPTEVKMRVSKDKYVDASLITKDHLFQLMNLMFSEDEETFQLANDEDFSILKNTVLREIVVQINKALKEFYDNVENQKNTIERKFPSLQQ
ncbi:MULTISPECIES: hypothetical protein [Leuconostoc]|uniref:Uncharacterized protein n=1 Tax=Leuconostoc falkenbergense TaxID=2766470 RepID=A0ABT7S149_9LACO|nr:MULTISPECIES: hypothetical protein [Leuconostoc]API72113.1 hypothetical protein A6B45_05255 [Leuconostoc suionicum]MDM7647298.1 hypothetical protein [Leuconostoc falkenbergense]BAX70728.1 hypothetical protein LEUCM_01290 [Leuconostoc suionicum]